MSRRSGRSCGTRAQRGVVLVVGLILLVLLTLIGLGSVWVATQEERMSMASRDRLRALEAAEVALRDCEAHLGGAVPPAFSAWAAGSAPADPGMYLARGVGQPELWTEKTVWTAPKQSRVLDSGALAAVAAPPRCIVERLVAVPGSIPSRRAELPQGSGTAYRITARGVGTHAQTVAMVQSFYLRD